MVGRIAAWAAAGAMGAMLSACVSAPASRRTQTEGAIVEPCRIGPVRGDSKAALLPHGRLVVVTEGLEALRVRARDGRVRRVALPVEGRWPGIDSSEKLTMVSWIEKGAGFRAVVARLRSRSRLGKAVEVMRSGRMIIDSEVIVLRAGRLLLFVTQIKGKAGCNQGQYTMRCLASGDRGKTWAQVSQPVVGPFGINIEDPRAVETTSGDVLLAYERELEEGGSSEIMLLRSKDGGLSWSDPSVLWPAGADVEPGGFIVMNGDELWFIASTDEDCGGGSYAKAVIKGIRSVDQGLTWTTPITLITEPDQISFGGEALRDGRMALVSLRHYRDSERRGLYLYVVDPQEPSSYSCLSNASF